MKSETVDLQPNLYGSLIWLRPLRSDDFEGLYQCASDPRIWEQHPEPNRYRLPVFQEFFNKAIASGGALAVVERSTGSIMGSSRFYHLNLDLKTVMIGFTFLGRDYWGGSFNREMKSLMLRHAFQFVDFVLFEIGDNNLRSRKAIEKIGADPIEIRNSGDSLKVIYRITRQDAQRAGLF